MIYITGDIHGDIMPLLEFIDSPDDPFYSESNMKHLSAVIADVEAGKNMAVHELIDDEELLDAMKEAKEISAVN